MDLEITLVGESLLLQPERSLFWPAAGTLLLADTHWGKAATFRAAGLPVPRGTTMEGLARLDALLHRTHARRVIFLGDFLHARQGRAPGTLAALADWRERWPAVEMRLVRGNHDRHAGDPPAELGIDCVDGPVREGPFTLGHHPTRIPGAYVMGGHIHPAVRLTGKGHQRETLPCFWIAPDAAVLPAFGDFTGVGLVSPAPEDRVYVVAGGAVMEIDR